MSVIEIAYLRLAPGATHEEFIEQNRVVEADYIPQQPGFLARELAENEAGEYIVVVHWRSVEDADASMSKFATDPTAEGFMKLIDANTLRMERYRVHEVGP